MAQSQVTIGQWTESDLAKYIRESIERLLPSHIPGLTVDDLIVAGSLRVLTAQVDFSRQLIAVGTAGAAPFTNSWHALGGGWAPPAYWKDEDGIVHLEGVGAGGTLGAAMFPLPPGYRPNQDRIFPVVSSSTFGAVQITAGGNVIPLAVGTATNAAYSLDGISFRTGKT